MSGWDDEDVDDVAMGAPPPTKSLTEQEIDKLDIDVRKIQLQIKDATGKEKEELLRELARLRSLLKAEKEAHETESRRLAENKGAPGFPLPLPEGKRARHAGRKTLRKSRKTRKVRKTRKSRV